MYAHFRTKTSQKHNKSFGACYLCGKPLRWKKDDTGKSIQLDLTGRPHECPKNMHKGSTITKPIQHTKVEVKKPEEKLEEIQPVQISESILFDIEKIPKDDPIINEIIDGHNEKQLGIIHYDQLKAPDPEKIPVGRLSDVLDNKIIEGLKNCGIDGLLEFQEKAIRAILNGKSTI